MAEPHFAGDDDLPRTFRREREAREREAALGGPQTAQAARRDYEPAPRDYGPGLADPLYAAPGLSGTVNRFDVPFFHLMWFLIKAVLAAIPALILLTLLLFAGGQVLKSSFPALRHFEIIVKSTTPEPVRVPPVQLKPPAPAKK
jgi:hypothetical protein